MLRFACNPLRHTIHRRQTERQSPLETGDEAAVLAKDAPIEISSGTWKIEPWKKDT